MGYGIFSIGSHVNFEALSLKRKAECSLALFLWCFNDNDLGVSFCVELGSALKMTSLPLPYFNSILPSLPLFYIYELLKGYFGILFPPFKFHMYLHQSLFTVWKHLLQGSTFDTWTTGSKRLETDRDLLRW